MNSLGFNTNSLWLDEGGLLVRSLLVEGEVLGLVLDVGYGGAIPVLGSRVVVVRAGLSRSVA